MKLAISDGQRREASPGLSGQCPVCGTATIAKCGEKNIWHWAHKGKRNCDKWWENETEWHRDWKNRFPIDWQEVVQRADDGEKHIADVKTGQGWVIEFQHSYLRPDERRAREVFYKNMLWVVDGLRRKNDFKQFHEAVNRNRWPFHGVLAAKFRHDDCRIVAEWGTSPVPVLFDFGETIRPPGLWLLVPCEGDTAHLFFVEEKSLVQELLEGVFDTRLFLDQVRSPKAKGTYSAPRRLNRSQRRL